MYGLDYTVIANETLMLLDKRFIHNCPFEDIFLHTQTVQFFMDSSKRCHQPLHMNAISILKQYTKHITIASQLKINWCKHFTAFLSNSMKSFIQSPRLHSKQGQPL